jgi:hypothetical protein
METKLDIAPIEHVVDEVFAPVDRDNRMERVGGGFETEVYCTEDRCLLVKLKSELGGSKQTALALAKGMRMIAEEFAACLGPEHTIPSQYVLSRDSGGNVQVLVVQPFLAHARPLAKVDFEALSGRARELIGHQLRDIINRQIQLYRKSGYMPDLYGLSSTSREQRLSLADPKKLPGHVWNFFVQRNLLNSYNLLLTDTSERRIVLVDYDLVRWPPLARSIYFALRRLLFWRDRWLIWRMERRKPQRESTIGGTAAGQKAALLAF